MTLSAEGAIFAAVARHATRVSVALFENGVEVLRVPLDHRRGNLHWAAVPGIRAGQHYGLRVEGPQEPGLGHVYDAAKLLIDPYARAIDGPARFHPDLARFGADTAALVPKSLVSVPLPAAPPLPPGEPDIIYEIAVRGFTMRHPLVPAALRGTVGALGHPAVLDHLEALGVDTVELMPLAAAISERHLVAQGLENAWGYNPVSFLAPDPRLAPGGEAEVRQAVAALHARGIRVLLDVVYNHTGESDYGGGLLSLRGLDNALYFRLNEGVLANDTGCGNMLALDRPDTVRLVMDALRHWAAMGFDGFRYDLATVMGRSARGFEPEAPLLTAIAQDPALAPLIHIAEPWDVGTGGFQLGRFPAGWKEWNSRFKEDVRRFWRGDAGAGGALATRLAGSSDIFGGGQRAPDASVNYVAAHDGFTLADAVRHATKDNHANGEGNRDGDAHEVSWTSATPGSDMRALLSSLLLARGTPMLTAGDEFGRSQRGNNNAYAQDNALTWLDWENADRDLMGFVAGLLRLRRAERRFFTGGFLSGQSPAPGAPDDVRWLGADGGVPDWDRLDTLGMLLGSGDDRLLVWFNRASGAVTVRHPESQAGLLWRDAITGGSVPAGVPARSVLVLVETPQSRARRGASDAAVSALARAAGIAPDWWEVDGTHHTVSPETERALLRAMGLESESLGDVRDGLARLGKRPGTHVVTAGVGADLALPRFRDARLSLPLIDAAGREHGLIKPAGVAAVALPPLAPGIHRLKTPDGPAHVIAAPEACHLPPSLTTGGRGFGLSGHLYALSDRRDRPIGDFETLARFAEAAAATGAMLIGINPLHHMFPGDRRRVSPYQPSDRRFIDPVYLDLDGVAALMGARVADGPRAEHHVDYAAVSAFKMAELKRLWSRFRQSTDQSAFRAFAQAGGAALAGHGAHEAPDDPDFAIWLQWLADTQLAAAAGRGRARGLSIGLYRDLALGCAYDGGETAAEPGLFAGAVSIGAPPDPFSASGQVWNLPPFNPLALEAQGFAPYRAILAANMRHAGALRIDHVLGFFRQFWVPRGAEGGDGAYVAMNLEAFVALVCLESRAARCLVIGEDLGTVPEGLSHRLARANILSYRMLWFERDGAAFRPPAAYPRLAAACLSSHDLPPFPGWLAGAPEPERRALDEALAREGLSGDPLAAAHGYLARTPSALMLVQADDLTGETEPLNVPGTGDEAQNWRRRLSRPVEELPGLASTAAVLGAIARERPN